MKAYDIAVFLALLFPAMAVAEEDVQYAVSATGADSGNVSWTLGEVVTETVSTASVLVVQGFNQPAELAQTAINKVVSLSEAFSIYPNPVDDVLHIDFQAGSICRWRLSDLTGRLLESGQTAIADFSRRPSGSYLIHLAGEKGRQTIVVIKK